MCQLKMFIGPLKAGFFELKKHFLGYMIILTLTFTFQMHVYIPLNGYYYFSQQRIKRTDAWFQVFKVFWFFLNTFNEPFRNVIFVI